MKDNKTNCLFGLHSYEIHKEIPLTHANHPSTEIGLVIISRCTNCGKIKHNKIKTVEPNYN